MRVGVCLKYLKRGGEQKQGKGKLGQGMGVLKGSWSPLTNYYALSFHTVFQVFKVVKNLLDSYTASFSSQF